MLRLTGELADLAQTAMADAAPVLANARRASRRVTRRQRGLLRKAINELDTLMTRAMEPFRTESGAGPATPRPQDPFFKGK